MIETIINVRVVPKSSRSKIILDDNDNIKVYLNSPPVDGKANKECISLLSKKFSVPKSNILIVKGDKGRDKRIKLIGISEDEIIEVLKSN